LQIMETTLDIAAIFAQPLDSTNISQLKEAGFASTESLNKFLELVSQLESKTERGEVNASSSALTLGLSYLLLGDQARAAEWLERAPDSGLRRVSAGQVLLDQRRFQEAVTEFEKAASQGYDRLECNCLRAEAHALMGNIAEAEKILNAHTDRAGESSIWNYARGRVFQEMGEFEKAMDHYEKAVEIDSHFAKAMFHLAYVLDLHGSDARARDLYLRCSELPYVHVHALINLAIMHEDRGEFLKAERCLRRVLAVNPNHARAQLYLKDVAAAEDMFIDDHQVRITEKNSAVMDIPVSDFELSVRSRNCLKKMNINTLGDLLRISEAELLAYKNFGETSLREIKAMLAQKGLSLGQYATNPPPAAISPLPAVEPSVATGVSAEMLTRPVMAMELSVRSRKCLQRLGINTIGELLERSEQELLESRNFGQTSLKEVKGRLAEMGLGLRNGPPRA
jgi:DNA-directed RNA polymerase subunit alpha